ncbi:hypothetical protein BSL78_25332 [Apostichopus japonicus]|uniref:Uncharacterized protein n=1 Tax=Stichopus japonicus TaxID=307972 RepID=A0A2G8JQ70_STIJA|nr:hypothetical protein BSL78_25332 [Apostichopus japonicus]
MDEKSHFDENHFEKGRDHCPDEESSYHPKLRESTSWLLKENINQSSCVVDILSQADHFFYTRNWHRAAQLYLQARELLNEKGALLQRITLESLSRCYLHLEKYETSMEWAQKLLKVCQSSEHRVIAHNLIADICHGLGHSEEEGEHLKFCLSRQPLNGSHWFRLGLSYLSKSGKRSIRSDVGGKDRCHHKHNKSTEEMDHQINNADRNEVNAELESMMSQSNISGHHKCESMNGLKSKAMENNDGNRRRLDINCEKGQKQTDEGVGLKSEVAMGDMGEDGVRQDMGKKFQEEGLSLDQETELTTTTEQNGADVKYEQREDSKKCRNEDVINNSTSKEQRTEEEHVIDDSTSKEQRKEEGVLRGVGNHQSHEGLETFNIEGQLNAASHNIGKSGADSCHGTSSTDPDDEILALICFIRARLLLKQPTSSLCNTKSRKVLMEVESHLQLLDFTKAFVEEIHQLCRKRQFRLEMKQSKTEDNKKKGRNDTNLVNKNIESRFEDFWFHDILRQAKSNKSNGDEDSIQGVNSC